MCVIHQKNTVTSKRHRTSSQGRCLSSRLQNLRKAVTVPAKDRTPQTAHHVARPQATSTLPPRSLFQNLQRMLAAPSNSLVLVMQFHTQSLYIPWSLLEIPPSNLISSQQTWKFKKTSTSSFPHEFSWIGELMPCFSQNNTGFYINFCLKRRLRAD